MSDIKALIADDEEGPREQLRAALARLWPELQIVAASANGVDAWDDYLADEPQICFLDIRMPGLSGLEVARRMAATATPPQVVFVTAFDDHAISAFDAGAVDYLLKPVDEARLSQAITRLQGRVQRRQPGPDLQALLQQLLPQVAAARLQRPIQASLGREVKLIAPEDVIFFESDNRYTRVVHLGGEALIRTPLKELLASLDAEQFWQVHRSVLVNSRQIASALRIDENTMVLTLKGREERLPVSRQFQGLFKGQ
ncbi:LytR/AlgR family response regulator transcription factor [Paucibacter sp. XJ19-41]|uniref:LytR/AlgR family response regulator transcription factor n=1 Tax=Paucibacter sp. XJ19-41 TaxID=2927824 RepID=UPI00234AE442|nr:LytTR family DNA-binding domain-containing protein [Paucibacter sp. XJ19-41]MDC6170975.1 LytTR family DNA-binding domain-containing protein [Paucibacter sp. XJ19-41]